MINDEYQEQQVVKREVVYARPSLFRRVMANLVDLLIFAFVTFLFLLCAREIVNRTPAHLAQLDVVNNTRLDSCLYIKYKDNIIASTSYIETDPEITTDHRKMELAQGFIEGKDDSTDQIVGFINFCGSTKYGSEELYNTVCTNYDDFRLNEKFTFLDQPYFIKDSVSEIVVVNPLCLADNASYYKCYKEFLDNYCQGVLSTQFPEYRNALRSFSIDLFAIEIPVSYALAGILVYLVPTLIFKRGHKTIGKLAYKIGVVYPNCLNISTGKNVARFAIFYFAILLLSLVTFGVPILITFTMMAFSKKKQGFQDYMLNLYEVDTTGYKIYNDLEEAKIDQFNNNKKPIDFKRVEKE